MALNRSTNKTPSSRSGYLTELSASTGKSSFLFPVRIKFTPNKTAPLSEGKKNIGKMMKPMLIKDLFPSTKKDRRNTIAASATTQRKRASVSASQPYLNTQSCYKPKNEEEKLTYFNRKSSENSKVRRQLYPSPSRSVCSSKNSVKKNEPKKDKTITNKSRQKPEDFGSQTKDKASNLLPPNSIKNNYMRRSGSIFKPPSQQNVRRNSTAVNKKSRKTELAPESGKIKGITRKNTFTEAEVSGINNFPSLDNDEKVSHFSKDVSTMTSMSNLNEFDRPSVIMSPFKMRSACSNYKPSLCSESQTSNVNETSYICTDFTKTNTTHQNPLFDEKFINNLDVRNLTQLKCFLDQSYKACENQAYQLKQSLQACENQASVFKQTMSFVDNIISSRSVINKKFDNEVQSNKCDESIIAANIKANTDSENITEKNSSQENKESIKNTELSSPINTELNEIIEVQTQKNEDLILKTETKLKENEEKIEIEIPKVLITCENSLPSAGEKSPHDITELSTIGEVSCENDDIHKYDRSTSENKENMESSVLKSTSRKSSLKTPRSMRRKSTAPAPGNSPQRRSLRLAARRLSMDSLTDSPKDDSFILLENELNVSHEMGPPKSKSVPASPSKIPPMTPGSVKQWDKRVQRPLKEYMALKMNGTFLVTPDAKRFQSCLEPTDTPHSRKSLSRKIFMELCDLYAESPEHD